MHTNLRAVCVANGLFFYGIIVDKLFVSNLIRRRYDQTM